MDKISVSGLIKIDIGNKTEISKHFNSFKELIEITEKIKKGIYYD